MRKINKSQSYKELLNFWKKRKVTLPHSSKRPKKSIKRLLMLLLRRRRLIKL